MPMGAFIFADNAMDVQYMPDKINLSNRRTDLVINTGKTKFISFKRKS